MSATQVECKLIRDGGTFAEVGGVEYHFAPNQDGAHVCEIANEDHADVFLSIREAYRLYRGASKANAGPAIEKQFESATAHFAASAPVEPELVIAPEPAAPVDEREALADEYEALYGKKPHHKTSIEKLRELIAAKKAQ